MTLNPYLSFNNECQEAFEFYRSVFGGEFITIQTFRDAPKEFEVQEEDLDRIMHVSLPIGSSVLMGSDVCTSFAPPRVAGNNFSLCYGAETKTHADQVFAKLSDGGKIIMPMGDVFWGSYYGKCTDKFGITWDIMSEHTQA